MAGIDSAHARGPDGMRLYAIGDVHGRVDLLRDMHALIRRELRDEPVPDWRVVHLGDYVDRGPESCAVIELLVAAMKADARNIVLAGNHDIGFLDFLMVPQADGLFAKFGGYDTALSYGVRLDFRDMLYLMPGHAALCRAVPDSHLDFLSSLRFSASFGDYFFCHAGIRPGVALDAQDEHDLTWIRRPFLDHPGLFDKVVVHGHTPVEEPQLLPNRINVDTGAFRTGRLTAVRIDGVETRFLSVTA